MNGAPKTPHRPCTIFPTERRALILAEHPTTSNGGFYLLGSVSLFSSTTMKCVTKYHSPSGQAVHAPHFASFCAAVAQMQPSAVQLRPSRNSFTDWVCVVHFTDSQSAQKCARRAGDCVGYACAVRHEDGVYYVSVPVLPPSVALAFPFDLTAPRSAWSWLGIIGANKRLTQHRRSKFQRSTINIAPSYHWLHG